ncbi:MAG: hypothetical protein J2P36_21740, partial [Ktedonobacteraceae bacterium]|nr:hypothetical protein [Ktedonobacteraceae bacterium]
MQRDWSDERLLPHFSAPQSLEIYDLRGSSFDVQLSIATAAGLINRAQPRIYLVARDDDLSWLQTCLQTLPCTYPELRGETMLLSLIAAYRSMIEGFVIYDPAIQDSINIATMLAAQRDGMVVSPSLAQYLHGQGIGLPIVRDLRSFHWKSRTQAYRWAYEQLLPSCSSMVVAGLSPTVAASLRPFLAA